MNSSSLECYDIFNDYLGLSNVVGGQEDPYYWMQSILEQSEHEVMSTQNYEINGYSRLEDQFEAMQLAYQNRKLSDVERLFGRGAVLHKPTNSSQENRPAESSVGNSKVLRDSSLAGFQVESREMNYSANSPKPSSDSIQLALDAILRKYSYLQNPGYKSQKVNSNVTDRWLNSFVPSTERSPPQRSSPRQQNATPFLRDWTRAGDEQQFLNPAMMKQYANNTSMTRFVGCSFCKNNKEVKEWFMSHQLKDNTGRVTCPVLRSYECPLCDATGDNAHTIGHCPLNPNRHSSLPLAIRTKANATGKKKFT